MILSIVERRLSDGNPRRLLTRRAVQLQGKLDAELIKVVAAHLLTFCEFVKLAANDDGRLAFST
jgi:hypothetical protein